MGKAQPKHHAVIAKDYLDLAKERTKHVEGKAPCAVFMLKDGTVFEVLVQGNGLRIRNTGEGKFHGLVVTPHASNEVRVDPRLVP